MVKYVKIFYRNNNYTLNINNIKLFKMFYTKTYKLLRGKLVVISKDYNQNKNQVLKLYDEYVKLCQESGKKVEDNIREQAERIKNEVFNLMILGEAKSGKSTFINAYLGKEVVPMDVRQCTSAIIKIRKGDRFELIAKTADGEEETITGDDKIRKFLEKHAAIPDKYRNIPITTINNELLIKYKDKKIPDKELKAFLEDKAKDNIFNMDIDEYNKLIKSYIEENKKNWGKIITEIEIAYELPEEMKGITIIDSPGVGAGGNVGRIAEEYIKNANAIIFVKSLNGQALESSSFMNFLRHNCTNRKKEALFLVFTGKSNLQGAEFASLKEQAIDMYKNDIDKEKILFVDSKVQLFLNKCNDLGTEEVIDKFFQDLHKQKNDFLPASNCWLMSNKNVTEFNNEMEELSDFRSVQIALERFARVANYIQLYEFLENLNNEYKRYKAICLDTLSTLKENVGNPQDLEIKINDKKEEIQNIYNIMSSEIDNINRKYIASVGNEGIITVECKKKQAEYEEKLKFFSNILECDITDQTFNSIKKLTFDIIDEIKNFRKEMSYKIIDECNQKLIQYTNDTSQIPVEVYIPNFTESDFIDIDKKAKDETSGYKDIESGLTFKSVEQKYYHNLKKHVSIVINNINGRLKSIIDQIKDNIIEFARTCIDTYKEKLNERKRELENEYDKLLEDKENKEKLQKIAEDMESKLHIMKESISEINILKGELKNYVG